MKKIFMTLLCAAVMISCGGNKEITALMESIYGGMEFDKATEAERALLNRQQARKR